LAATEAEGKGLVILFYALINSTSFLIIHWTFLLAQDWSKHVTTEYAPAKTGEYPSDIPQFSKLHMLQKIFEGQ